VYRQTGTDSVFYVKGGTSTFAFRDSIGNVGGGGGGGKIYYFNGGVNLGTFAGLTMYELGDTAVTSAAANFTRSTTGNLANFITDVNRPGLLQIPAGVWTVDAYLSETGGGSNHAEIWIEVEKWDGSTITTIATSPIEQITNGNVIDLYTWGVSIPTTTLAVTDRIIIQFYISNTNGKTVTLYTQNGYVGEVHTTFTTGIGSLNGLTAPTQYFATGTSGTDFAISSSTATHTFNLPTASGSNRGALSSTDWTTFNSKVGGSGTTNYVSKFTGSGTIGNSQIFDNGTSVGINTATPSASFKLDVNGATRIQGNVQFPWADTKVSWLFDASYEAGMRMTTGTRTLDIFSKSGDGNDEITFSTGATPTEKMRITNGGNVGIGTISPTFLLDVNGTARIGGALTISGATTFANSVWNTSTDGRERLYFTTNSITYLKGDGVVLRNNSNTDVLTITSTGNTLIGTSTDAGFRFDVSGTTRISGTELRLDNGTTGVINLYSNTPEIRFASADPTGYRFYRSGTTMIWNAGGTIQLQISSNSAYDVSAANGHIWRTANSGGTALARLDTGGSLSIGKGSTAAVASSILELSSTTKGFLPPRMTNAQMVAIATPAAGLVVYDTTNNKLNVYDGTNWVAVH
jgi:hypothetical protein